MGDFKIKLWNFLDWLKDFIVRTVIIILIIITIGIIFNGFSNIIEAFEPYRGNYYDAREIRKESGMFMNILLKDKPGKTIVILSEHDEICPVIKYKALADELSSDYRVVVVENFGYGFSSVVDDERTNENIATEIRDLLDSINVPKPYVLLSNRESMLYAMKLQQMNPENVDVMINVDGIYPELINDSYYQAYVKQRVSNEKVTYYLEKTGIESVLSYFKPKEFGLDKFKALSQYYGDDEIAVYRNRIAHNFFAKMKMKETENLENNMKELLDYKYPPEMGVLSIFSSENIEDYKKLKNQGNISKSYEDIANSLITNSEKQISLVVTGEKGLEISNVQNEANGIKDFLRQYYELNNNEEVPEVGQESNE